MSEKFHQANVRAAADFELASLKSKTLPVHGVQQITGQLKDEGHNRIRAAEVQSYRFPVENFSKESAKQWLKENKIEYQNFEEADSGASVTKTKTKTPACAGDILIAKNIFAKEAQSISAYEIAINKASNPELKKVLSRILAEKKVLSEQVLKWYVKS